MNGLYDNAYILRRVKAEVSAHATLHYVGSTLTDQVNKIEELTAKFSELTNEHDILANLNQILAIEKKINDHIHVAEMARKLTQARFDKAWANQPPFPR